MNTSDILQSVIKDSGLTREDIAKRCTAYYSDDRHHISAQMLRKIMKPERGRERAPSPEQFEAIIAVAGAFPKEVVLSFISPDQNPVLQRFEAYPRIEPPFAVDVRAAFHVSATVPSSVLTQLLPAGISPAQHRKETHVVIVVQAFKELYSGAHADFLIHVPVCFGGSEYLYLLDYFVDSAPVYGALREIYGHPAKLGKPRISEDFQEATLTIAGLPMAKIKLSGRTNLEDAASRDLDRSDYRMLTRKRILNPDGKSLAIDQLVSFGIRDESQLTDYSRMGCRASLEFECEGWRSRFALKNTERAPCVVVRNISRTMSIGRIEYDYLRHGYAFPLAK